MAVVSVLLQRRSCKTELKTSRKSLFLSQLVLERVKERRGMFVEEGKY